MKVGGGEDADEMKNMFLVTCFLPLTKPRLNIQILSKLPNCISYSLHCYNLPDRSNQGREGLFWLTVWRTVHHSREDVTAGVWGSSSHHISVLESREDGCRPQLTFSFPSAGNDAVHSLSSHPNQPYLETLHRHTQSFVFVASLGLVLMTILSTTQTLHYGIYLYD